MAMTEAAADMRADAEAIAMARANAIAARVMAMTADAVVTSNANCGSHIELEYGGVPEGVPAGAGAVV